MKKKEMIMNIKMNKNIEGYIFLNVYDYNILYYDKYKYN